MTENEARSGGRDGSSRSPNTLDPPRHALSYTGHSLLLVTCPVHAPPEGVSRSLPPPFTPRLTSDKVVCTQDHALDLGGTNS